jgi:predicted nucleic acid-binding protein
LALLTSRPFDTRLLASTVIAPVDSQLARFAGFLRRQTPRLKATDSPIVATALLKNTTLLTRNVRDFQQIDTLQLLAV